MVKILKNLQWLIFEAKLKRTVELKIEVYKTIIRVFIINFNSKSHFVYFYFKFGKFGAKAKERLYCARCKTESSKVDKNNLEKTETGKLQNFRGDIFQSYCCGDIYGEGVEIGDNERKPFFLGSSQEEALKRLNLVQSFLSSTTHTTACVLHVSSNACN